MTDFLWFWFSIVFKQSLAWTNANASFITLAKSVTCYRDLSDLQAPSGERSLQSTILPTNERTWFVAVHTDEARNAYEWTCIKSRRRGRSEGQLKYLWDA